MSRSQRLYELQTTDLEIGRLEEELAGVESHFGETEELLAARQRLLDARERKRDLDKQLREIDLDVQTAREHVKPLETKLYSGRVHSPKELDDLNKQVVNLKDELRVLEDRELELMSAAEEAEAELTAAKRALVETEQSWRSEQAHLEEERTRLNRELEALRARRAAQVAGIPAADVEIYELLRLDARHRAVSRVERGTCQVCRITLPASDIRRARSMTELVRCSSCGRVLYAP